MPMWQVPLGPNIRAAFPPGCSVWEDEDAVYLKCDTHEIVLSSSCECRLTLGQLQDEAWRHYMARHVYNVAEEVLR